MPKFIDGFKNFILRGNAVDLAVGVVIGASFNSVINSLVKGLITPLVTSIARVPDFSGWYFIINGNQILYGEVVNTTISFFISAFAIYFFAIVPMNIISSKIKKKEPQTPKIQKCPECLSEIPLEAKRCAFCSQKIKK